MFKDIKEYVLDYEFSVNLYKDKVNVVNYIDIIAIEKTRISLTFKDGVLVIKGYNLLLKKMLDNEVLICGSIKSLELGE